MENCPSVQNQRTASSDQRALPSSVGRLYCTDGELLKATATKEHLVKLETTMATKDDITRLEDLIKQLL